MEMIVTLIRLVYHDATLVRLELEVADAVLLDVLHHIGKHRFDEVCTCITVIAVLGSQAFTDIPNKVSEVEGGKSLLQSDEGRLFALKPYILHCTQLGSTPKVCGNTGGGVSPRFELSAQEIVLSAEGATEGIFAHANIPRLG